MALLSDLPTRSKCTKLDFTFRTNNKGNLNYYVCDFLGTHALRGDTSIESVELFVYQFLRKFDGFKFESNEGGFSFYVKNISLKKIKTGADIKANAYKAMAERQYWDRVMS